MFRLLQTRRCNDGRDLVPDNMTIRLHLRRLRVVGVPPSISGLNPSSGQKAGGTSVVISGSGFPGTTAVDFGARPATGYTVDNDSQITATASAGTFRTVVDVQVTTAIGTNANTAADDYTYIGNTYFVRTDGSDSNTGLSNDAAGA